jgi:GT2 family glycosyltransferase
VVIPSNRSRAQVEPLLRMLTRRFTVTLVENGTQESRLAEVAEETGAIHLHSVEAGTSRARNRGAEAASTPWLLFLDDDCRIDDGGVDVLAARVAGAIDGAAAEVGAVTGSLLPCALDDPTAEAFEREYAHNRGFVPRRFHREYLVHPRWPLNGFGIMGVGGCFLARREAWKDVDGFDERFGGGAPWRSGEDDIFFLELVEAGWSVWYEPALTVRYEHLTDVEQASNALYGYGYGHSAFLVDRARRHRRDVARFWARTLANYVRGARTHRHGRLRAAELRGFLAGTTAPLRRRRQRRDH